MENKKEIIDYVMQLSRLSRRTIRGSHHISRGAFKIMRILEENEPIRSSDLATILDIRPSSLTEALNRMERHELINRVKDESDSRSVLVSLTEKGKSRIEENKKTFQEISDKLQSVLTDEEQKQFASISEKLITFLEAEQPTGLHKGECRRFGRRKFERTNEEES